jgi:hypothetical protein
MRVVMSLFEVLEEEQTFDVGELHLGDRNHICGRHGPLGNTFQVFAFSKMREGRTNKT